uniref:hypothetical protein n=1 Tax=Enterococcus faecalis TaxID=1351 RepID=UPI003D7E4074
ETKKVIIRLPLGSFRRFQLKSMNYSGKEMEYVKVVTNLLMVSKFFTLQSDEDLHTLTLFGTLLI